MEFSELCIWPSTEPGSSSQKHCLCVKVCASWCGRPQHSPHVYGISLLPACTAWIQTPAKSGNSSHSCFPFVSSLIKMGYNQWSAGLSLTGAAYSTSSLNKQTTPPMFVLIGHKEELFCSEKHSQTLFKGITVLTWLPGVTHDPPLWDLLNCRPGIHHTQAQDKLIPWRLPLF